MEEWFSGALAYPWLLASQALIILLYGKIALDFSRGRGFFVHPSRRLGNGLLLLGSIYLSVMVIRYVIRMSLYPHERWTGGSIPIFFHWVLASFLLTPAGYHRRYSQPPASATTWKTVAVRGSIALLITIGVLVWITDQLGPWWFGRTLGLRPSEFAVRIERVSMKTADGVTLVADIYHPLRAGRAPAILVRVPYSKTLTNMIFGRTVGSMWAEHGYTAVIQGTRGRYESGGTHYPLRGERQDGLETLAWLARQPWFDGRLGMWGGSSFGQTQWVLADQANPGPSALMIWLASSSFHDMFYPGGAFSLESALFWGLRSRSRDDDPPDPPVIDRGAAGWPLRDADQRAVGERVPFFQDLIRHSGKDAYWSDVDSEDGPRRLKAPVLLMGGWFDPFLPVELQDFIRIRREAAPQVASATRLVIGPWAHAWAPALPGGVEPRNFRIESLAPSVAWFDQFLRPPEAAPRPFPTVRIFVMGANVWRDERQWPLERAKPTPYYLRSGGVLAPEPPVDEAPDSYLYDPQNPVPTHGGAILGPRAGAARQNEIETRSDVLVYTTFPLAQDLEATGPVQLILHVSTTVPNTDFSGKLVDVHPDGAAYNVSDGILRRAYNADPAEIALDLWPTSIVFLRGHRIRLEVSSSNFPRFDRNPNTGRDIATEARPVTAQQKIYHSRVMPSRLILPVVPR